MYIQILFSALLLFIVIFGAVRLAIKPLIEQANKNQNSENDLLNNLKWMGVIDDKEYKLIDELNENKLIAINRSNHLKTYSQYLENLKEKDIISEEVFEKKMQKLKNYYQ